MHRFIYLLFCLFFFFCSSVIIAEAIVRREPKLQTQWPQSLSYTCPHARRFKFLLTRSNILVSSNTNQLMTQTFRTCICIWSYLSNVQIFQNYRIGKVSAFFISLRLPAWKMWNITKSAYRLDVQPFGYRELFNESRSITALKTRVNHPNLIKRCAVCCCSNSIGTTAHVHIIHILLLLVTYDVVHVSIEMHYIHCTLCSFL